MMGVEQAEKKLAQNNGSIALTGAGPGATFNMNGSSFYQIGQQTIYYPFFSPGLPPTPVNPSFLPSEHHTVQPPQAPPVSNDPFVEVVMKYVKKNRTWAQPIRLLDRLQQNQHHHHYIVNGKVNGVKKKFKGDENHRKDLFKCHFENCDYTGAKFHYAIFTSIILKVCDLEGANLSFVKDLSAVALSKANFDRLSVRESDLINKNIIVAADYIKSLRLACREKDQIISLQDQRIIEQEQEIQSLRSQLVRDMPERRLGLR